jgi:hypothetical protein
MSTSVTQNGKNNKFQQASHQLDVLFTQMAVALSKPVANVRLSVFAATSISCIRFEFAASMGTVNGLDAVGKQVAYHRVSALPRSL